MLILTRRAGESLMIGDDIQVEATHPVRLDRPKYPSETRENTEATRPIPLAEEAGTEEI